MISLIVAYDQNRVIGLNGKMPWHFKEDLAYFKKTTEHHPVLMGRKTYESILKYNHAPLKNRAHVVASRTLKDDRVLVIDDIKAYLDTQKDAEIFVIGGAEIYAQTLPIADRLYITHIDESYEGDTYFPDWDVNSFKLISETKHHPLRFAVYERNV
jgi:dihydrofolate reductase